MVLVPLSVLPAGCGGGVKTTARFHPAFMVYGFWYDVWFTIYGF